ncbi:MAG: response regulator transcription factor [Phycisphaerae bacterium]
MTGDSTVFVVDDDASVRRSLGRLLGSIGYRVESFPDADSFLAEYDAGRPGCLLLDIQMPGMNGLALQEELVRRDLRIPVIVISAYGDVEATVRAIKTGAVDFLQKPYKCKVLLTRIREALEQDRHNRQEEAARARAKARLKSLTPREREVMEYLVEGQSSKQIAFMLGLSRKTIDIHRAHVMTKLDAESVVDLVHMWAK